MPAACDFKFAAEDDGCPAGMVRGASGAPGLLRDASGAPCAAAFVEVWIEHFSASALEHAVVHQLLHRVAAFLYEVVCAFVIQDLNALLERDVRKASAGFLSGRPSAD
jgi:hypothetical protein